MDRNNIQYFNWGHIEWIYQPKSYNSLNVMSIGISTILPGKRQPKHVHFDEQVIHVISGEGQQKINNKSIPKKPGAVQHIEAGAIHEAYNDSDKPIIQLLISTPVHYEQYFNIKRNYLNYIDKNKSLDGVTSDNSLTGEISSLYEEIITPLKMPVSVFDKEGNPIIIGKHYPLFCREKCRIDADIHNCNIYRIKGDSNSFEPLIFLCPYGLTIYQVPIVFDNRIIGFLKGGHIREPGNEQLVSNTETGDNIQYDAPESTVNAALSILKRLSNSIASYYFYKQTTSEMNRKENRIHDIIQNKVVLEKRLRTAKEKMLSIQFSNHFLFNTLNSIASMAMAEKKMQIYNAIIDLSNMFKYLLRNNSYYIELKDEISYIKNYINLQKLRYKKRLVVNYNISQLVEGEFMPFNCLQPIIENCFKHGFRDMADGNMVINISAKKENNKLIIEIEDNGAGIEAELLKEIKYIIQGKRIRESNGLKMVFSKLDLLYGEDFQFDIKSEAGKGTKVIIEVNTIEYQPNV